MLLLNYNLGTLFLDWNPFEPVRRVLSSVGLTEEEVDEYETPFDRFRHQEAGEPLTLPEDVRTSEEWFDLLFGITEIHTHTQTGEEEDKQETSVEMNEGLRGQINLDNIGRDFLALIYYRQRVLDLFRRGGLTLVLTDLFKARTDEPLEYMNLNNSLLPVEALTDFLTLRGAEFRRRAEDEPTTILTDPPLRHLPLGSIPMFSSMLRDSSNLSRWVRVLSVCLQDGGHWENLIRIPFTDFDLSPDLFLFRDRREVQSTRNFGFYVSMTREFCLWDIHRDDRLPSVRQISDNLGIPYLELLRIVNFGETNRERGGIHRFGGLEFLRRGFPDRLVQIFVKDIERTSNLLTNNPKPDKL